MKDCYVCGSELGENARSCPVCGTSADEALSSGVALVGTVDEVCDTLHQRREEWGVSYVVLGHDTFEQFGPVVERLAGT